MAELEKTAAKEAEGKKIIDSILDDNGLPDAVKNNLRDAVKSDAETFGKKEPAPKVIPEPVPAIVENAETVDTLKVKEPTEVVEEVVDKKLEVKPVVETAEEVIPETPSNYEQMYLSLKGKYDAEIPRLIKIAKSKDDVIDFYKDANKILQGKLDAPPVNIPVEDYTLTDETKQKFADMGFDGEDLGLLQSTIDDATRPLREQLAVKAKVVVNTGLQAFDSLLVSDGYIDSVSMKKQPQYDFSMQHYEDRGFTPQEILDSAISKNDNNAAADLLRDVQMQMVEDGRWKGKHPMDNPEPEPAAEAPIITATPAPKAVFPHSVNTPSAPIVKDEPFAVDYIEKLSMQLQKGKITEEVYEKEKTKYLNQLMNQ